jgi:hypothetical protein
MEIRGEQNCNPLFSELFDLEEIDDFINLLPIVTKDIEGNKKRFSISVIRKLLSILIRSKKNEGKLLSLDSQKDLKFQIVGMNTIRQFERLANVKFDESKFSTQREFQQYIRELMLTKDNKK